MALLDHVCTFASLVLQLLIIAALLRGHFRKHPILLALITLDFLGTVVGAAAIFDTGTWTRESARIYWICEGIQYTLVFACQVHMLYPTLRERNTRLRLAHLVIAEVLLTAGSAWLCYHPRLSFWMTQMARNFCFASVLLNLTLWTSLIRSFDRQRLLITASLGFLVTGGAIGHSLRQMSPHLVLIGNLFIVGLYLLFLFTLWRAVRVAPVAATNTPPAFDFDASSNHAEA